MSDTSAGVTPAVNHRSRASILFRTLGPLIGLLFAWGLFAILAGHDFIKWDTQRLMLLQTAVVGTAAIGATLIIIAGGIDLSVGSMIALGTMVVALLLHEGAPPILAGLGGVVTGALVGAAIGSMVVGHIGRVSAVIVGLLSTYWTYKALTPPGAIALGLLVFGVLLALNERFLKRIPLPSFIITLGMLGALRGLAKGLGDSRPVYLDEPTWLTQLMQTSRQWPAALPPPGVWLLLLLALVMGGVLGYTRFGRHIFAVGSNPRTARLAGIHVERVLLLVFIVGIGCAGLAALLEFAFLGQGDPTTANGYELKVIAAVVIGGASLSGGEGSIRGTIIGALIMTVVATGCTKLELDNWIQDIVTGAIIVAAVALDQLRQRGET